LATSYDVTLDELEQALDAALQSDRRSQRFLHDAAHQLRTPLAVIRASLEALLLTDRPEERDRLMVHVIRETSRASRLVTSLLQIARLDASPAPPKELVDLLSVCTVELGRVAELAPTLALELHEPEGHRPVVRARPDELADAFGNLLDNARRYARSRIDLTVRTSGRWVTVEVRDDGPGLLHGDEDLAFERFFSRDRQEGAGLGLPIARAIAEADGGTLSWEAGAFVLRLPVVVQPAVSAPSRNPANTAPG
jgi:two-component system, OmpR family, sensor kinase